MMENKYETIFKGGDKVKLVASAYPDGSLGGIFNNHRVGDELTIEKYKGGAVGDGISWNNQTGVYGANGFVVTGSMLALIPTTPKSMLKDFTRIVTTEGDTYIVARDMAVDEHQCYIWLDVWDSELKGEFPELDVKQIFECEDNSELLSHKHLGTLIWQRETPEDISKKNKRFDLMASMKTLQTELDVMKKTLEEME